MRIEGFNSGGRDLGVRLTGTRVIDKAPVYGSPFWRAVSQRTSTIAPLSLGSVVFITSVLASGSTITAFLESMKGR